MNKISNLATLPTSTWSTGNAFHSLVSQQQRLSVVVRGTDSVETRGLQITLACFYIHFLIFPTFC